MGIAEQPSGAAATRAPQHPSWQRAGASVQCLCKASASLSCGRVGAGIGMTLGRKQGHMPSVTRTSFGVSDSREVHNQPPCSGLLANTSRQIHQLSLPFSPQTRAGAELDLLGQLALKNKLILAIKMKPAPCLNPHILPWPSNVHFLVISGIWQPR